MPGGSMLSLLDFGYSQAQLPYARKQKLDEERLVVTTCADHPEYFEASVVLEDETWEELSFLDFTAAHHEHYNELLDRFPDHRLCMIDLDTGELVATGMCVPLYVDPAQPLPREGWDWIVNTAEAQKRKSPNTVGALSISVPKQHRERGFARDMVSSMRAIAARKYCSRVIAPVRPSAKCEHPYVPMDEYVSWRDRRGRIFDPWLRSHVAAGGEMLGVCDRSMVVEQPIDFWKPWTQSNLEEDGAVPFKGALVPLEVDHRAGVGRYIEPNVWVTHKI